MWGYVLVHHASRPSDAYQHVSRRGPLPPLVPGSYYVHLALAAEPLVTVLCSAPVCVPLGTHCMYCARLRLMARQRTLFRIWR